MRITERDLNNLVFKLNKLTDNPTSYSDGGEINIGHFHIDSAYGGYKLVQTTTKTGSIKEIIHSGFVPKRKLYDLIDAYIRGIEL